MIYTKLDNHDVTRLKVTLTFDHLSFLGFEKKSISMCQIQINNGISKEVCCFVQK